MSTVERVAVWNFRCSNEQQPVGSAQYYDQLSNQLKRIREEADELEEAIQNRDLKEIIDAINDLDVVVAGAGYMSGGDVVGSINAVLDNNDQKYSINKSFMEEQAAQYKEQGTEVNVVATEHEGTTYYALRREEDGKVMKPFGHPQVDLDPFVPTPVPIAMIVLRSESVLDDEELKTKLTETFPYYQMGLLSDVLNNNPETGSIIEKFLNEGGEDYICIETTNGEMVSAFVLIEDSEVDPEGEVM